MPTLTPYFDFNGRCREALAFYESALGAKVLSLTTQAQMPAMPGAENMPPLDPRAGDTVMHACLQLPGGAMVFAGDGCMSGAYQGVKGVSFALDYASVDEAHSAFHALAEGGQVTMPMQPALWAKAWGMLVDRYGVAWIVNGEPTAIPA